MSAFRIDQKLVNAELRLLRDPLHAEERPYVLDLVQRLQRAATPDDYFQLHLKLLGRLRARQQVIGELKDDYDAVRKRIAELAKNRDANLAQIQQEQRELERLRHLQALQSALRFALLNVGDGLAWRALEYDRAGITVLGEGERVAWLAEKDGFDAELVAIDEYWKRGIFAFHNDLTTCIRHGDVTAITPHGRELVEVKRGHKPGVSPQMRRLDAATKVLNTGRHVDDDGRIRAVVDVPVPYRTYLANLRQLIAKARRSGYAAGRLGQLQFTAVMDHRTLVIDETNQHLHPRTLEKLGWLDGMTRTVQFSSLHRRLRDRRHSFATAAPFSIFPLAAEDVTDLVLGHLDYYSLLNLDLLEASMRRRGLAVQIPSGDDPAVGERFMLASRRVGNRDLVVQVRAEVREQMLMEYMTPATLAATVQTMLEAVRAEPRPVEVGRVPRLREKRVWGGRGYR